MSDTTQTNRAPAYNLAGVISNIQVLMDRKNRPYTTCQFDTVVAGKATSRKAMAFGKAHDALEGLQEGPGRLYVRFDGGVLAVIGLGLPPKSQAAAA
jgi:hypothetical protein